MDNHFNKNNTAKNRGKTYADIPNRDWALKTPEAMELIESFPKDIKNSFINCFLNSDCSENDQVLNYLLKNSEMAPFIKKFPGSCEMFEYLYLEKKPKYPFDYFFIRCKSGIQINKRLISLEDNLPLWINKLFKGDVLKIDNFFSGPGRDMVRVLQTNPELINKVNIRNIDIDKRAMEIGERLVSDLDLNHIFSFVNKPFHETKIRNADLILLIGVLCPLKLDTSKKLLEKMIKFTRKNGYIIYSTAQYNLLYDDPLSDYFMRLCGWHMSYKTDEEAYNLANDTGWEPIAQFFDEPLHHHCMTVARLK